MQGEAVLGLEAAARALVRPGMTALNLVSGVYAKWFGVWLAEYGANLVEVEVPYDEARPGRGRGAGARGPPRDGAGVGGPLRDPLGHPQPAARDRRGRARPRGADGRRRGVVARRRGARRGRLGHRPLRGRSPEVPGGAARDVARRGRRAGVGGDPGEPGGAPRLVPLPARLEGALDRRRPHGLPIHPVRRRRCGRGGRLRRGARHGPGRVDRDAPPGGAGDPRRGDRDGPAPVGPRRGRPPPRA